MKLFVILGTAGTWVLGLISLYLAWGLRLQGLALFIPLFGFTLSLLMAAFDVVLCLWLLCRSEKSKEEMAVYLVMGLLTLLPLAFVIREYRAFPGAGSQFLLKFLMS